MGTPENTRDGSRGPTRCGLWCLQLYKETGTQCLGGGKLGESVWVSPSTSSSWV